MDIFSNLATDVAIIFLCYLCGMFFKAWTLFDDKKIPFSVCIVGVVLGIISYFVAPDLLRAPDVITALASGGFCGLTAVGINQMYKQGTKVE